MPIRELYSKRLKRERGELPDVFLYDVIPEELRVQVIHILDDGFAIRASEYIVDSYRDDGYGEVHDILCREYGQFALTELRNATPHEGLIQFFLNADTERALDTIEVAFQVLAERQQT